MSINWDVVLAVAAAISAAGLLIGLALGRKPLWKCSLIVGVLSFCGWGLYPPGESLKLGLDLAGGTSLLYEVNVEDVGDPDAAIRQTIETLKKRVDPDGVRNLAWRQEAGNRVEIQMPRPSPEVELRRRALEDIEARINASNISRSEIAALTAGGQELEQRLMALERGVAQRVELLRELVSARQSLDAARADLAAAADDEDKRIELAGVAAVAEQRHDAAMAAVMASNVSINELRRVLNAPDKAPSADQPSPRQRGIDLLLADHPARADEINQYIQAYDAYQQVKGPLDDPTDLIRLLQGAGVLEFRITVQPNEAPNADELREQLQSRGPGGFAGQSMVWVKIDDPSMFAETATQLEALRRDPVGYLLSARELIGAAYGQDFYVLCWNTLDRSLTKRVEQEGWAVEQVWRTVDPDTFYPAVSFSLNSVGARLMSQLSGPNVGRQMAMILDNNLISAPTINSRLGGGSVIITGGRGGFTQREQEYLVRTMGAGSLQARLSNEPIAIRTVGPNLGRDNLTRGLVSARDAMVVVCAFMFVYYFFAGAVASAALTANIVIILGIMSLYQAAFTLPGIAGIVLTIGMAVDANVLIYERIREELNRGIDLQTALRLGYQKALSAIIDGNLTNLIVCVILYQTATVEVRGFAVTLGIGILATLFTALFMTRLIFDLWYGMFGYRKMRMLPITIPLIDRILTPSIPWMKIFPAFMILSVVLIAGGITLCFYRGVELLDIEFRAGTEVAFELAEGKTMELEDVRRRVREAASTSPQLAALANATVVSIGDETADGSYTAFSLVSTIEDPQLVSDAVKENFADVLNVQPALTFRGVDAEQPPTELVLPITRARLGELIGRSADVPIDDYRGGVAILVQDIEPAVTVADVEGRLRAMRLQPDFEHLPFRQRRVIGLSAAPGSVDRYNAVAIVLADEQISYFNNTEGWEQMAADEWQLVRQAMSRDTSLAKVANFTPTVAQTLRDQAIVAILLSLIAIIAYIWFRFGSFRHGVAASVALVHDTAVALGALGAAHYLADTPIGDALLLGEFRINLGVIAAILTLIGYSLNDTIVVFDRIRENRGKLALATPAIIDNSINQTISRTILTAGTTLLALVILYVFGGEAIRGFAFVMIVGVSVGTYSSVAIASPLLLLLARKNPLRSTPAPLDRLPAPAANRA